MSGLRELVFATLAGDSELNDLGYTAESLYPNYSPDSPPGQRFGVIRWGATDRGVGGARPILCTLWLYNREPDFDPIGAGLKRARQLFLTLEGQPTGTGWVIGMVDSGESEDTYDDIYRAVARNTAFQIAATGE